MLSTETGGVGQDPLTATRGWTGYELVDDEQLHCASLGFSLVLFLFSHVIIIINYCYYCYCYGYYLLIYLNY